MFRKKENKIDKLVTTCEDKEKYVIHIVALQQALKYGLKIKEIHGVIEFDQKPWMRKYVMLNTKKRMKAKNEFENFFKLVINSVFGKIMENVRNRRDLKLVTTNERRKKLVSEPNYHSCKRFNDNFMAIEIRKTQVEMFKPIYVEQALLDISKTLMYEFSYEYIKPKYGNQAKLCYMDTDSFIINIETDDFFKDVANDAPKWFNTSGISKNLDRPLTTRINKKIIGKFKVELNGNILTEFIALGPKVYSFKYEEYDFKEEK